jgi:hypothetical protein
MTLVSMRNQRIYGPLGTSPLTILCISSVRTRALACHQLVQLVLREAVLRGSELKVPRGVVVC